MSGIVGGHYFEAMEIPLRRGRFFNEQDDTTKPIAVIVDEYMADQLWPGQDPDRQAHSYCRTPVEGSVADGGWRGRTREARFSRLRPADRFLPAPDAIPHAGNDGSPS